MIIHLLYTVKYNESKISDEWCIKNESKDAFVTNDNDITVDINENAGNNEDHNEEFFNIQELEDFVMKYSTCKNIVV